MSKKATKTTSISPTTATSPAISPERPAANSDAASRPIPPEVRELLALEDAALENGEPLELCMTANQVETLRAWREEPDRVDEEPAIAPPDLREPEKFAALRTYIDLTLSVPSVEAQIRKLTAAGLLTDKNLWETKDPWHVAATALAKVKDPVWLAGYWPSICFLRGKTLGNPRNEAQIAMSIAVIETVGGMIGA